MSFVPRKVHYHCAKTENSCPWKAHPLPSTAESKAIIILWWVLNSDQGTQGRKTLSSLKKAMTSGSLYFFSLLHGLEAKWKENFFLALLFKNFSIGYSLLYVVCNVWEEMISPIPPAPLCHPPPTEIPCLLCILKIPAFLLLRDKLKLPKEPQPPSSRIAGTPLWNA